MQPSSCSEIADSARNRSTYNGCTARTMLEVAWRARLRTYATPAIAHRFWYSTMAVVLGLATS